MHTRAFIERQQRIEDTPAEFLRLAPAGVKTTIREFPKGGKPRLTPTIRDYLQTGGIITRRKNLWRLTDKGTRCQTMLTKRLQGKD